MIRAALLPFASREARWDTLTIGTGQAKTASSTVAAAAVIATNLAQALGNTIGRTFSVQALLLRGTETAEPAAAVFATLFAIALRYTNIGNTFAIQATGVLTLATTAAAAVRAALFACAIGLADKDALSVQVADVIVLTGPATAAAAVRATLFARAFGHTGNDALTVIALCIRRADSTFGAAAVVATLFAGTVGLTRLAAPCALVHTRLCAQGIPLVGAAKRVQLADT